MNAAVGPTPLLGQIGQLGPANLGQLGHKASTSESIDFSRLQDVLTQRSGFLGMTDREMGEEREGTKEREADQEMEVDNDNKRRTRESDTTTENNGNHINSVNNCTDKDLSERVTELQESLDTLRRESDTRILQLQRENEEASRVIERLQQQLKQQTQLNLNTSLMNLSRDGINPLFLGHNMPPTPPTSLTGQSSLELLLMERAKAMTGGQKNFPGFPGQGFPVPGLFPTSVPNQMQNFNSEDLLSRWRSNLSLPPNIQEDSTKSTVTPSPSPDKQRDLSPERAVSPPTENLVTNGGSSKPPSEVSSHSPRRTESTSPVKSEDSALREMRTPELPTMCPLSPYNSSNNLPIPSLLSASRIPKSDPMEAKLQEMLRINIEKNGGQPLDTLADSRRVRELLSVHNIGQRLFAKYVLGLSQGTVSELLSKPKSWDKLTEKGRDSYRKMNAWAYDDKAIMLLKSLIPRKGELVRPLSQSPLLIKSPSSMGVQDKASPSEERKLFPDPSVGVDPTKMAEDPMSRMYKEEFSRILGNKNLIENPPSLKTGLIGPAGLNPLASLEDLPRSQADIHQAISLYQEELSRLQSGGILGMKGMKAEDSLEDDIKSEDKPDINKQKSLFPASKDEGSTGSPLQRMASITNALVSQPPPISFNSSTQRPLRNTLPPITQQQFDRYSHVNTDDTVRRIKEILSQYSISQRLFGEAVLGLSQGSVSDLLARPKPWHMLTQKGREPFIRMRIFLEDDSAVHRLVASQYKIAPDKLMRAGPFPNPLGNRAVFPPTRPMGKLPENLLRGGPPPPFENPLLPSTLRFGADPNLSGHVFDPLAAHRKMGPRAPTSLGSMAPTPNLYEMAALTSELDTQAITTKVKELLLANNVGQKMFGETVLGLSQGSVSELLSKPKPWHMLSIKGREPFIRMQMWLNDPANMDKLASIKNERRDAAAAAGKRRYGLDSSSDRSSPLDTLDDSSNHGSEPSSAKKMRQTTVSDEQREALTIAFALDPYPGGSTLEFLANELGIETKTISSWFNSHRMRLKQLHGINPESLVPPSSEDGSGSFDPTKFRILMAHRRMELQTAANGAGFPFPLNPMLFGLPAAAAAAGQARGGLGVEVASSEAGGGLDLRYRMETDGDFNDGEEASSDCASDKNDGEGRRSPENTQRSRRKPAAPQWVNPEWPAESGASVGGEPDNKDAMTAAGGDSASEKPINGVCVRNIPVYGDQNRDEEQTSQIS